MIWMERIDKEVEVVENGKDVLYVFNLAPISAEHIQWTTDMTLYKYGLTVQRKYGKPKEDATLMELAADMLYNTNDVTNGYIYLIKEELDEFKSDPYKFCTEREIFTTPKEN